jgi:hypothetical protein
MVHSREHTKCLALEQHYIKEELHFVEDELAVLVGKPNTLMQLNYRPELDVSALLNTRGIYIYIYIDIALMS